MSKHQEKREESKTLLVNTALQLFSRKGYDGTSIRAIAAEAGVSLGLMYNYFESKEALLLEIFNRGNKDIEASFAKAADVPGAEIDQLEQHILQTVHLLKEKRAFWRLLHSLRLQSNVLAQVVEETNAQTAYIEAQIRQNLEAAGIPSPDLEAKLLFATIDGIAHHYLLLEDYPIDGMAALLIQKYKSR